MAATAVRSRLALFAAVACTYAVLATSAYEVFGALEIGVTFFPPAGLTFAAFLLLPRRSWPPVVAGVVVAETLVDMAQAQPFWWSLGWAAANVAEPVVGATVTARLAGDLILNRRFAVSFLVGGLLVGPMCGAAVGATVLAAADQMSWAASFADIWVGDALGVLVVAPLLLVTARRRDFVTNRTRPAVTLWVATATAVVSTLLVAVEDLPLGYVAVPLLALVAVRFGAREVATAGAVLACVLTAATARGRGPWSAGDAAGAQAQLLEQQTFLLVALGLAWLLKLQVVERLRAVTAAHVAEAELRSYRERERDRRHLDAMNGALRALAGAPTSRAVLDVVQDHAGAILNASAVTVTIEGNDIVAEMTLEDGLVARAAIDDPEAGHAELELPLLLTDGEGRMRLSRPAAIGWPEQDQIRAMAFASIVSDSLDRTARHEADHRIALTLQRAIMPDHLTTIEGAKVHALYRPASTTLEIGGDWYDLTAHDEARALTVVIGDVVGHNLTAAATMGKLASAGRALAHAEHEPHDILSYLDIVAADDREAFATTVACARIAIDEETVSYSLAGHPPPLIRSPEGRVSLLQDALSAPLAVTGSPRRHRATVPATRGTGLLFYTDGLVEDRRVPLSDRLNQLVDAFAGTDPAESDTCDRLLAAMLPDKKHDDDVAVVCVALDA